MSIELHCPKCTKLIRAPDSAGGKHGKCPYCEGSVYIPMPHCKEEEILLAPLDEEEERRLLDAKQQSTKFAADVGHATAAPQESGGKAGKTAGRATAGSAAAGSASGGGATESKGESVDVATEIERFAMAMRDSKLEEADASAERLKAAGRDASAEVKRLTDGKNTPVIEGVPPPVVQGFLKNLLQRLG